MGQPGVLVTLEEPAADLRANLATLGWDIEAWEASHDFEIVDASPLIRDDGDMASYSFETLAALRPDLGDLPNPPDSLEVVEPGHRSKYPR